MLKNVLENKMLKERFFTKIKINKPIHGNKVGTIIRVETDKKGIPLIREWRNRFKDALKDGCIEKVSDIKEIKKETIKEDIKEDKEEVFEIKSKKKKN